MFMFMFFCAEGVKHIVVIRCLLNIFLNTFHDGGELLLGMTGGCLTADIVLHVLLMLLQKLVACLPAEHRRSQHFVCGGALCGQKN